MFKKLVHAFFMCLSMFTRIPAIYNKWDEEAKDYILYFFPFVGALLGGIAYGIYRLFIFINLPWMVVSLFLFIYFYLVTGFIHFDGFMDVVDATSSYRDQEERIRILKDPHVGSFAVCYSIVIMLVGFVSYYCVGFCNISLLFLIFVPFISRCMSPLMLEVCNTLKVSEYNKENKIINKGKVIYFICLIVLSIIGYFFIDGLFGIGLIVEVLVHLICTLLVKKNLGGINGDVCGFSSVMSETLAVLSFVIIGALL